MKAIACAAVVAGLVCSALVALPESQGTAAGTKAFTDLRLFDGSGSAPIANAAIVVRDGRIVAAGPRANVTIPADAERISLASATVVPGLINAHGHVTSPGRELKTYAQYGVTTVLSLGGETPESFAARDAQRTPALDRARIFVAGTILTPNTPEEARRMVADHSASKADFIKIRIEDNFGTTPKMPATVYRAVIDEAHKRGARVAAHLFYLEDAKGLLDAGVDLLAHSVRDTAVDQGLIATLKSRNVCLVPTLMRDVSTFVYESTPAFFSDPLFLAYSNQEQVAGLKDPARQRALQNNPTTPRNKAGLDMGRKNLKTLADAGVTIAMGTDSGAAGRFQGYFELMELEQMVSAGLSPRQALVAATGGAARCLKLDGELGTLTPGKWADFVAVQGDPLTTISDIRKIGGVFIAGNRVTR